MKPKHLCTATSVAVLCVMAALVPQSAQARTFKVLFSFNGADGGNPYAGLIQDAKGNLYGTTPNGGAYSNGVVFKLDKVGQETVLYNFCSQKNCADGTSPFGGLILDAQGNLYGTTLYGGTGTGCYQYYALPGCGTVFKLSKTGKETVLHSFKGGSDGDLPWAGVIQDKDGSLYGTTWLGGGTGCYGGYGCGTVFKLSKTNKETVLHRFSGTDGDEPLGGVILDNKGNLYGTTQNGGSNNGFGTVFKLTKTGKFFTELYAFSGMSDGAELDSGVIQDAKGNLYGTTRLRGAYNYGTVFELSTTGQEITLWSFTGGGDGASPRAGVIRDAKGNLHGTTAGAAGTPQTVFKLSKTGNETTLHSFNGTDGDVPDAGLIRDAKGNLYGTTYDGGTYGYGVVFKLTP